MFGTVLAATSLQLSFQHNGGFSQHRKVLTAYFHQPSEPDFAHASIRILFLSCSELDVVRGSVKIGAAISKSVSGFPACAQVAVTIQSVSSVGCYLSLSPFNGFG